MNIDSIVLTSMTFTNLKMKIAIREDLTYMIQKQDFKWLIL